MRAASAGSAFGSARTPLTITNAAPPVSTGVERKIGLPSVGRYSPVNRGGRFSRNAAIPSA